MMLDFISIAAALFIVWLMIAHRIYPNNRFVRWFIGKPNFESLDLFPYPSASVKPASVLSPHAVPETLCAAVGALAIDDKGTLLEYPTIDCEQPEGDNYRVPIFYSEHGEWVYFDLRSRSWAVIGATGSGKGNFIMYLLLRLVANPFVNIVVIDAKAGLDYNDIKPAIKLYIDEEITTGLLYMRSLLDKTNTLLSEARVKNIEQYNLQNPKAPLPYTVVVIDEGAELDNAQRLIAARIARMGRAAGIIMIYATQYPTVEALPSQISANLVNRICFQVASPRYVVVALAREPGDLSYPRPDKFPGPGICVYKQIGRGEIVGRVPELTDKMQEDLLAARGLDAANLAISNFDAIANPLANLPAKELLSKDEIAWGESLMFDGDSSAGISELCKRCGAAENLRRTKSGFMCWDCWGKKPAIHPHFSLELGPNAGYLADS